MDGIIRTNKAQTLNHELPQFGVECLSGEALVLYFVVYFLIKEFRFDGNKSTNMVWVD